MPDALPSPAEPQRALAVVSPVALLLRTWLSDYSPSTREAYLQALQDFARFTRAESVEAAIGRLLASSKQAGAAILAAWREDLLHGRGKAAATINARQAAMRSLLAAARDLDLVPWAVRLKDLKTIPYRDTRGPGLENLQAMLGRAERIREADLRSRNVLILRLLFDLGLRGSEVVGLDMADVDLPGKRLWILGKGRTQREPLTLPTPTLEALKAWLRKRGGEPGPLLTILSNHKRGRRICRQTVFRLVRDLGRAVGCRTSPHKIRHTSVTTAATSLSLLEAQRFARHSNPQTTMRYIDNARNTAGTVARTIAAKLKPR